MWASRTLACFSARRIREVQSLQSSASRARGKNPGLWMLVRVLVFKGRLVACCLPRKPSATSRQDSRPALKPNLQAGQRMTPHEPPPWLKPSSHRAISGWDRPLLTFSYPGFEQVAHLRSGGTLRARFMGARSRACDGPILRTLERGIWLKASAAWVIQVTDTLLLGRPPRTGNKPSVPRCPTIAVFRKKKKETHAFGCWLL